MSATRITIADDSQPMRMVYKRVLETQVDFEVVGMASDGEEALERAMELIPDVAILDIVMPKKNGIEVAQRIIKSHPDTGKAYINAISILLII